MNASLKKRLFSELHSGNQNGTMKLINSIDFSHAKEWPEGHDLLRVALDYNHRSVAKLLISNGFKIHSNYDFSITPLHYTAIYGYAAIAKMLLNRNAQIDAEDSYGRTSLHHAIENNKTTGVKLLLNRRACINISDRDGITPIQIASKEIHLEIVKILLNYGAYGNIVNPTFYVNPTQNVRESYTPLHYVVEVTSQKVSELFPKYNTSDVNVMAVCRTPQYIDVERGQLQSLLNFSNERASANSECTSIEYTPLHLASVDGSTKITRLLLIKGAGINAVAKGHSLQIYIASKVVDPLNEDGETALCCAVERRYSDIIEQILKCHPDLNNASNKSSLNHAIKRSEIKYKKIVDNLLENGFHISPIYDCVLLHSAVKYGYLTIVGDLLYHGAYVNVRLTLYKCRSLQHTATICLQEEVAELLINCGAYVVALDIHQKTSRKGIKPSVGRFHKDIMPLHISASRGCVITTKMLLNIGFNVNAKRADDGATALHIAAGMGCEEVVKMLLENGATVNSKTHYDMTPLHLAARMGHQEVAEILIQFGAEVDLTDECGYTALFNACYAMQNKFLVRFLIQNGSDINIRCPFDVNYLDHIYPIRATLEEPGHSRLEFAKIIIRHVAKLKTENLFVNGRYLQTILSAYKLRQYYFDCERELTEMKNRKISNTRLSFNDFFLIKDVHQLAIYAGNENIVKVFESTEYVKVFPIYADELKNQLKKGLERQGLLKSSLRSFSSLFGYELTYFLMNKILSYQNNLDLRNLIYARSYCCICASSVCRNK